MTVGDGTDCLKKVTVRRKSFSYGRRILISMVSVEVDGIWIFEWVGFACRQNQRIGQCIFTA